MLPAFEWGQDSPFLTRWWWRAMCAAGLPAGEAARFLALPGAALPLRAAPGAGPVALTGPYTALYQPLLAAGADPREAGAAAARACRPVLRLDAVDAEAAWLPPFLAGARRAGLRAAAYDHFGNWHEALGGRDWGAYLADRPGSLRETVRRRTRKSPAAFSLVTGGEGLAAGIAAYEAVYGRSWKVAEPFPDFAATLMRLAAEAGALRLGLLHLDGAAIAAQLWVVHAGTAHVLKLAHDEAHKAASPGTVLTARMLAHLIDVDRVAALDFGRGDDPYKQLWTTRRRQRIGVILADPWRPTGGLALARQEASRLRQAAGALRRRLRR